VSEIVLFVKIAAKPVGLNKIQVTHIVKAIEMKKLRLFMNK
jgi:hypothetical protein